MSHSYDHKKIEQKWQERWEAQGAFRADDEGRKREDRRYVLDMFPYPSSQGLHVGHPEGYTATDIVSRYLRMRGSMALHPMGWDAFGLPAENYAIKVGVHPAETTAKSIENFRRQIKSLGFSYDWSREVNTADPDYYRWTQWFFLLLYQHGLAYKRLAPVNWCAHCQTVLAREQVVDGKCERCKHTVVQKELAQWFFKITDFIEDRTQDAKRNKRVTAGLLSGLEKINWPEPIKLMQQNWIGRSEGALIKFPIVSNAPQPPLKVRGGEGELWIEVFTTRPDTLFGATYMVLAPEHPIIENFKFQISNFKFVEQYIQSAKSKTELERGQLQKEKTGVELQGITAINPATKEEIPIWIADYVLMGYGTGAIMAVPAHDERDYVFAKKFNLPIKCVIRPKERKVLMVHGSPKSDPRGKADYIPENTHHWLGWITPKLEERGFKVFNPLMPNAWEPQYDEWKKQVAHLPLDENSVVIGHSAGGAFAVRWLGETDAKIDTLLLVAPGRKTITENRQRLGPLYDFDINPKIKDQVRKIIIFISDNEEEYRKESARWYAKELNAELRELKGRGHFTMKDMGTLEFPELLKEVMDVGCYIGHGMLVESGEFTGLSSEEALLKMAEKFGRKQVTYRLRDWLISRQRYWGAPIPIIYCVKCGEVPVPEKDLPVRLPDDVDFRPTGESPLKRSKKFHEVRCPKCGSYGEDVRRECDTMDTFVDSSWYFFRYTDPRNAKEFASREKIHAWLPVDLYVGGAEHAVMHLMYARFFTKVLHWLGIIDFDEPFLTLKNQGLILGEDGQKMSKSRGNVINPDEVIEIYGADTMRLYEMFMGPFEDAKPWSMRSIVGIRRFLERVWSLGTRIHTHSPRIHTQAFKGVVSAFKSDALARLAHQTIKKVTEDIEAFKFNTAIAQLMTYTNELPALEDRADTLSGYKALLILLAPFAPHITEELWEQLGNARSIFKEPWPAFDLALMTQETVQVVIQIDGKKRGVAEVSRDAGEEEVYAAANALPEIQKYLKGKEVARKVYVKGKLLNLVTQD
ncbi:MAG: class I tRNA ligase family protein [Patescibacteria group bacterium]